MLLARFPTQKVGRPGLWRRWVLGLYPGEEKKLGAVGLFAADSEMSPFIVETSCVALESEDYHDDPPGSCKRRQDVRSWEDSNQ